MYAIDCQPEKVQIFDSIQFNPTMRIIALASTFLCLLLPAAAGPFSYGVCQSGCNTVWVACYAAAGAAAGTVTFASGGAAVADGGAAMGTTTATALGVSTEI